MKKLLLCTVLLALAVMSYNESLFGAAAVEDVAINRKIEAYKETYDKRYEEYQSYLNDLEDREFATKFSSYVNQLLSLPVDAELICLAYLKFDLGYLMNRGAYAERENGYMLEGFARRMAPINDLLERKEFKWIKDALSFIVGRDISSAPDRFAQERPGQRKEEEMLIHLMDFDIELKKLNIKKLFMHKGVRN